MSTAGLFQRLRNLLPQPQVLVGTVVEIHDDDTSTVRIPGPPSQTDYAGNVSTGSLIRPRGTTVPVGQKAFVRAGVIETQAPDGDPIEIVIGKVVIPPAPAPTPAPPPPSPSFAYFDAFNGSGDLTTHVSDSGHTYGVLGGYVLGLLDGSGAMYCTPEAYGGAVSSYTPPLGPLQIEIVIEIGPGYVYPNRFNFEIDDSYTWAIKVDAAGASFEGSIVAGPFSIAPGVHTFTMLRTTTGRQWLIDGVPVMGGEVALGGAAGSGPFIFYMTPIDSAVFKIQSIGIGAVES